MSPLDQIAKRYRKLDAALRSGTGLVDPAALWERYAYTVKDHHGNNALGLARVGAADISNADPSEYYIPFTVTVMEYDRDGDLVNTLGIKTKNYQRNPVWFFGHQEWPVPIGKGVHKGQLAFTADDYAAHAGCWFDPKDSDAMLIHQKVMDGYLNATSIAFVPIHARQREDTPYHYKSKPRDAEGWEGGWLFDEVDLTEISIVGVPANAGALRDVFDREKGHMTPQLRKAWVPYCAKSRGKCFTGWCPCPPHPTTKVGVQVTMKHKCAGGCSKTKPCGKCDAANKAMNTTTGAAGGYMTAAKNKVEEDEAVPKQSKAKSGQAMKNGKTLAKMALAALQKGQTKRAQYLLKALEEEEVAEDEAPPDEVEMDLDEEPVEEEVVEEVPDEVEMDLDEGGEEVPDETGDATVAPPRALSMAHTIQHHQDLKDYLESVKGTHEPDHHQEIDAHIGELDKSINDMTEEFGKRYPNHDHKSLIGGGSPVQGEASGLTGETGVVEHDADDAEVEMDLDEEPVEEEKNVDGSEDKNGDEILDRYKAPPKGSKRSVKKRPAARPVIKPTKSATRPQQTKAVTAKVKARVKALVKKNHEVAGFLDSMAEDESLPPAHRVSAARHAQMMKDMLGDEPPPEDDEKDFMVVACGSEFLDDEEGNIEKSEDAPLGGEETEDEDEEFPFAKSKGCSGMKEEDEDEEKVARGAVKKNGKPLPPAIVKRFDNITTMLRQNLGIVID